MKTKLNNHVREVIGTSIARLYGYDIKKEQQEVIKESVMFFNKDVDYIVKILPLSPYLASLEWKTKVKIYEDNPLAYYFSSTYYVFSLAYGNYWNIRSFVGSILIAKHSKGRVLDYGGGIGTQLILAWMEGLRDLTYYDIEGPIFEFAKFRFKRRSIKAEMIPASDEKDNLEGTYDTIICREVLEHVKDPLTHLKRIDKHLNKGGRLFLSYHFERDIIHPMHFKHQIKVTTWLMRRSYVRRHIKLLGLVPLMKITYYQKAQR